MKKKYFVVWLEKKIEMEGHIIKIITIIIVN